MAASWLGSRLQASPQQQTVLRDELEAFFDKLKENRKEWRASREDIAKAVRGEAFDEEVMGESFARQDDKIKAVREALVGSLARIHDVLDEQQRERLAELIAAGGLWGRR